MNQSTFSIVIPTYNRSHCIERSLFSAIKFLNNDTCSEIIVVDDGSTDDTVILVETLKNSFLVGHQITIHRHQANKGVCAAKNTGAKAARGEWIIFLDSDDELIPESYTAVMEALVDGHCFPLHFFSCIGAENKVRFGSDQVVKVDFNQFVRSGTNGEKLPVIKRTVFNEYQYDEDMPGYESLMYLRIVKDCGIAFIHKATVRRYYTCGKDRLSSSTGLWRRQRKLSMGHLRVVNEHFGEIPFSIIALYILRFLKSYARGLLWRLKSIKSF